MFGVTVRERVRIRDKVRVRLTVGFVKGGALWLG
jgi:hypothetical protein